MFFIIKFCVKASTSFVHPGAGLPHILVVLVTLILFCTSCYSVRPSAGGAQVEGSTFHRRPKAKDVALPPGYRIEAVARGLTFPTGMTFDDEGRLYVVESGYSYGETWSEPRLLRVDSRRKITIVARGDRNGPWNGVDFHNGNFYVSEGGALKGGRILRISMDGNIRPLIEDLPSYGDHHTNGPVVADGYVYFAQGTATNAGVVGEDNADFGWLKRRSDFHDVPCEDIILNGVNYESKNVLTDDPDDLASTGAFVPFNTPTTEGQVVKGSVPCSGAVMRVSENGGAAELMAWGFRNPYGLAIEEGQLFVVDNGYDERGSRPVWGTGDLLWKVDRGGWYGWPDHSGVQQLDHDGFKVPDKGTVKILLKEKPSEVPKPTAVLGVHSSSNGIDFSSSDGFGFKGKAFIAQLGDMSPNVGKVMGPVGFKVVMVNVNNGVITDFAVNKGKKNGPASQLGTGGLERPIAVAFSPDGSSLYIADFGVIQIDEGKTISHMATGVIWRVTKTKRR